MGKCSGQKSGMSNIASWELSIKYYSIIHKKVWSVRGAGGRMRDQDDNVSWAQKNSSVSMEQ